MSPNDFQQTRVQSHRILIAAEPHAFNDVVGRFVRDDLVQKPHSFLGKRQRHVAMTLRTTNRNGDRELTTALRAVQSFGECRDGWGFEDRLQWKINEKGLSHS